MSPRKDPMDKAQAIFTKAAPAAAGLLVELMHSEEATVAQKLSCAESILSRVLGKAGTPLREEAAALTVSFTEQTEACAK